MKRENWDFVDFAFCSEMRNFYAQYLTQTPLSYFLYIGVALLHKSRHEDSLYESSVIAGGYEQLDTYKV
ncbi:hypothetical protein [Octadecabacter antarcticus]|uniref:hypothetical protein n=1 Tax=Octadecabacter antarcticus TaxID=1217908 RepID=UPI0016512837|nr:hypothetical protein [Octadecabacter antarcticus]